MTLIPNEDVGLAGLVINEPGFLVIEKAIESETASWDKASRISGNPFEDGRLRGRVEGYKSVLAMIQETRERLKNMEDK